MRVNQFLSVQTLVDPPPLDGVASKDFDNRHEPTRIETVDPRNLYCPDPQIRQHALLLAEERRQIENTRVQLQAWTNYAPVDPVLLENDRWVARLRAAAQERDRLCWTLAAMDSVPF